MIDKLKTVLRDVQVLAALERPSWAPRLGSMRAAGIPMNARDAGAFPLTGVQQLANVTVAFPGEHWSDGKANEVIVPGEMIVPVNVGGKRYWNRAAAGALDPRAAIALNVVQSPDSATGSIYSQPLGPNEIVNRAMQVGDYVHAYHSRLVQPDAGQAGRDLRPRRPDRLGPGRGPADRQGRRPARGSRRPSRRTRCSRSRSGVRSPPTARRASSRSAPCAGSSRATTTASGPLRRAA
jgi:hypothetical protein